MGARCLECRCMKMIKGSIPHGSKSSVVVSHGFPVGTSFTLRFWIRHERTQRKLELRHITRQLQFAHLAERFCNGRMQDKSPQNKSHQRDRPV